MNFNLLMHRSKLLIRLFLFWFIVFAFYRILFLIVHAHHFSEQPLSEILQTFIYAFRIDLSTYCYLIGIPFLLLTISFSQKLAPTLFKIIHIFNYMLLSTYTLIAIAEIVLYGEWGTKLNYKALQYILHPVEIIKTASNTQLISGILGIGASIFILVKLYAFLIKKRFQISFFSVKYSAMTLQLSIFSLAWLAFIIIFLRGGLQPIPIQSSICYYSSNNTLNLATINPAWNVVHSISENTNDESIYKLMDDASATNIAQELHHVQKDSMTYVLNATQPNIVFLLLESWSADFIKSCGGDAYTPNFDELSKEGILFTNIYATGTRSDEGMAANLGAYPDQPKTSIITQPSKYPHLPCISKVLKKQGYYSSFYFGGQLEYENIRSYLMYNEFDKLVEGKDFDSNIPQGKLGIHDEYVYARQLQDLSQMKQPFFSCLFTASTHPPFDVPIKKRKNYGTTEDNYLNSAVYADSCLGVYFDYAKKQPWYNNTLFVLISDHSRVSHKNWSWDSPQSHKIPMLFIGNVVKKEYQGTSVSKLGSQVDLLGTLLPQLHLPSKEFVWSKNLFNPYTKEFAYYSCFEGLGWISKNDTLNYYYNTKQVIGGIHAANKDSVVKIAQAYLQTLINQYTSY